MRKAVALFWQRRINEDPILIAIATEYHAQSIVAHFEWEGRWFIQRLNFDMNSIIKANDTRELIAKGWPSKEKNLEPTMIQIDYLYKLKFGEKIPKHIAYQLHDKGLIEYDFVTDKPLCVNEYGRQYLL